MKKFKKSAIIFLVAAILFLGFYGYMLARPISYGLGYHTVSIYEDSYFECTMTFYRDGTMVTRNTTFDEDLISRYYYKDGYVFFTMAGTEEEYQEEIAMINENFDEAIRTPFYADRMNAFRIAVEEDDGYSIIYNCAPVFIFAIVGGVVELIVIIRGCLPAIRGRKAKRTEK